MKHYPQSGRNAAFAADSQMLQPATPLAVQVLSTLLFGAFAIVSTVLAFVWFWPAGFALAVIIALRGFGPVGWSARQYGRAGRSARATDGAAAPTAESSGNASFDAYRAETLRRLEDEQHAFGTFLTRLRAARDQTEFDHFMDDRSLAARPVAAALDRAA